MCQDKTKTSGYCFCLANKKKPDSIQKLLIQHYIFLFQLYLKVGPNLQVKRRISLNNLMIVLDFFSKQGNLIKFKTSCL